MLKRFCSHKFLKFYTLYYQFNGLFHGKSVIVVYERTDFALFVAEVTGDMWIKNTGGRNEKSYLAVVILLKDHLENWVPSQAYISYAKQVLDLFQSFYKCLLVVSTLFSE